ncbi:hypothetical protein G6F32_017131 [Rhizopus arrhizus]|nr:hypothetical protein G6F32_017131 [Rhizopus arrhizus]
MMDVAEIQGYAPDYASPSRLTCPASGRSAGGRAWSGGPFRSPGRVPAPGAASRPRARAPRRFPAFLRTTGGRPARGRARRSPHPRAPAAPGLPCGR